MIKINNLVKTFDKKTVLNIENLEIENGKIYGFVGENGSGKSTLLRCITGIYDYSGNITIDGYDIKKDIKAKKNIFYVSDNPYSKTTIKDLIKLYSVFYDFDINTLNHYLSLFNVNETKSLNKFSKGMKRRVYLAFALAVRCKYIILDEAFDGVDIKCKMLFKEELFKLIDENNTTLLISTHSLKEVESLCDDYFLLSDGKLRLSSASYDNSNYIKYNIVLNSQVSIAHPDIYKVIGTMKIYTLYAKNSESLKQYINSLNPLVIETLDLDLEEIMIYVKDGGNNE